MIRFHQKESILKLTMLHKYYFLLVNNQKNNKKLILDCKCKIKTMQITIGKK